MADSKQGAGLSSGSSAAVHKANSLMNRKPKKSVKGPLHPFALSFVSLETQSYF